MTSHGPVHVWIPRGYDPAHAVTVVYVHGYYVGVDRAYKGYRLQEQFAASHLNALFVVCEAPQSLQADIPWLSLNELLDAVATRTHQPLPAGRIVAMGHSGGYREILEWLDEPELDTVVLLDAAYRGIARFRAWIEQPQHRMIDVGEDTRLRTDELHRGLADTLVIDGMPDALSDEVRARRVIYIRTDLGHMTLVTGEAVIPMLLRAVDAPR